MQRLGSAEDSRQRLNFNLPAELPQLAAMIESDEVVAVAYLDSVKLQFDLHDLVLVPIRQRRRVEEEMLRVKRAEILEEVRKSRAGKFLGEIGDGPGAEAGDPVV